MTIFLGTVRHAVVNTVALFFVVSCKAKSEAAPPAYAPPAYPPPSMPQNYPPQPNPWAAQPPPAFGFFCQSDNDVQCPYGHCLGGRCGGCTDGNQCKRGAACTALPFGMTCWPSPNLGPPPPSPPGLTPPGALPPGALPPGALPPAPNSGDPWGRARQICVDRINGYRARLSRAPLSRDPSGEPCADEQSRLDARTNNPHGTFGRCGEWAQNACPNYPGPWEQSLARCLDQMFAEGPGGGHYENMINAKYTRAWCGFQILTGDRIWMIQDFR